MSPRVSNLFGLVLTSAVGMSVSAMSVTLSPSAPSPGTVGSNVTWTASVSDAADGALWYRYRARQFGADFHVIRDYGPLAALEWAANDHEGIYEIEVSAINRSTGDTAATSALYQVLPAIADSPAINPTTNPLVFLYSAPPCPVGRVFGDHLCGTGCTHD